MPQVLVVHQVFKVIKVLQVLMVPQVLLEQVELKVSQVQVEPQVSKAHLVLQVSVNKVLAVQQVLKAHPDNHQVTTTIKQKQINNLVIQVLVMYLLQVFVVLL